MTTRIISFNANGIRSATTKGFIDWLDNQNADVVCIQETKAQVNQLDPEIHVPKGYHAYFHDAEKKGYSGVALYCRKQPDRVIYGMDWPEMDAEGRYIQADYGDTSVVSLYLPSGTSGDERQAVKYRFLDRMMEKLLQMRQDGRNYIICGDWNIAHKQIDIKNWRSNQKNSGFLPEERAWMDQLFGPAGYVDAFRVVNQEADQYTWWSNRGQARANNVGWRIDYHVITPELAAGVTGASIYTDERLSDHAPLILDYAIEL